MSDKFEQISIKPGFMKYNGGLFYKQVSENKSRRDFDYVSPQIPDEDPKPNMEDSRINLMPLGIVAIVAIGIVYFILRGKKQ